MCVRARVYEHVKREENAPIQKTKTKTKKKKKKGAQQQMTHTHTHKKKGATKLRLHTIAAVQGKKGR